MSCGFDDVHPIRDMPGRYACSKCHRVCRREWVHYLTPEQAAEFNKKEPLERETLKWQPSNQVG